MTPLSPLPVTEQFLRSCVRNEFDSFLEKMMIYQQFLYETNEQFNLTAIPPEGFWSKHVADSVSLVLRYPKIVETPQLRMCDVGCGAGLPSLVLASAFPNLLVTAVDSRGKKVDFVAQAAERMGLKNVRTIHARANEMGHQADYKHRFMLVTARAVSGCQSILRETTDLLAHPGELVIYRTTTQAEPEMAELAAQKLPPVFSLSETLELPESAGTRCFLFIRSHEHRSIR